MHSSVLPFVVTNIVDELSKTDPDDELRNDDPSQLDNSQDVENKKIKRKFVAREGMRLVITLFIKDIAYKIKTMRLVVVISL